MLIIGESLNASIAKVSQAIKARDEAFIFKLAQEQKDRGAQMLDVNAAIPGGNEVEDLVWLVKTAQSSVDLPLMLDSATPEALRSALKIHKGRPIVNSISGEPKRLEKLLPLVAEHGCGVVALCLGAKGIPSSAEGRLEVASWVVQGAKESGVKAEDIYVDPLVFTIATDARAAKTCLATLQLIHNRLPEVHPIGGISNVSFGMPRRPLLNAAFLAIAVWLGMDTFLVNVQENSTIATIWAANALVGNDPHCRDYLKAYRAGLLKL